MKYFAKTIKEFNLEKDKREKIYKENCEISGKLWDIYEKERTTENHNKFFEAFRKIDPSYLDWFDGVDFNPDD